MSNYPVALGGALFVRTFPSHMHSDTADNTTVTTPGSSYRQWHFTQLFSSQRKQKHKAVAHITNLSSFLIRTWPFGERQITSVKKMNIMLLMFVFNHSKVKQLSAPSLWLWLSALLSSLGCSLSLLHESQIFKAWLFSSWHTQKNPFNQRSGGYVNLAICRFAVS